MPKDNIERLVYDRDAKTITKQVTDSRGFSYSSKATVAGDLGGIYNILFTSDTFVAHGQKVQLEGSGADHVTLQLPGGDDAVGGWRTVHQLWQSLVAQADEIGVST